ncbi:hypothetical protein [Streptomyces uncialis]|uniref:hypothetical protein n=1 Tax=Streptomyces uncialis TaxID=1048205 RepID=UPI0033D7F6B6
MRIAEYTADRLRNLRTLLEERGEPGAENGIDELLDDLSRPGAFDRSADEDAERPPFPGQRAGTDTSATG